MIQFSWSHFHDLQLWNHSHTWGGWEFELLALGCSRKPNHNDHHHRRLRMGCSGGVPWDSSTHKGGDTQSPPFPHCNALHCTRIYTPLLLLLNGPFLRKKFCSVHFLRYWVTRSSILVDIQSKNISWYWLKNLTHSNQHQHLLTTAMDIDVKMWRKYADNWYPCDHITAMKGYQQWPRNNALSITMTINPSLRMQMPLILTLTSDTTICGQYPFMEAPWWSQRHQLLSCL